MAIEKDLLDQLLAGRDPPATLTQQHHNVKVELPESSVESR